MATIEFYPLDVTFKIVDDKPVIRMYGKTKDNKQICILDDTFRPYCLIIPEAKEDLVELSKKLIMINNEEFKVKKTEIIKKKDLNNEIEVIKVYTAFPAEIPKLRQEIKTWIEIDEVREYDLSFEKKYLIDNKIVPFTLTKAEGELVTLHKNKVSCFQATKVEPVSDDTLDNPKVLAFDIETYNKDGKTIDPENAAIIMVSVYGDKLHKVITWKNIKHKDTEVVNSEAELITRFKEIVESYKPDIITGYFSDGFDFPFLKVRAKKYKVKLDLGFDYSEFKMSRGTNQTVQFEGLVHLDLFKFVRYALRTALKTDSLSLDNVAQELLGEKKHDVDLENLGKAWDENKDLEKFIDYNLKDSELAYNLCNKLLPQIIELVKMLGLPIFDVSRFSSSQLVEWYVIKQASAFNQLVPNRPRYEAIEERRSQTFKGAFVFEPTPGLYYNLTVFDFRSLYPSIISALNIGPGTLNCDCCKDSDPVPGEKFHFCKKKKGFVPSVIEDIIERRARIKEIIKKEDKPNPLLYARQMSLKLLANSFYGYLGFFAARWYSNESARSVTAYGRHYIKDVIEKSEKAGFKVVYSDTDSIFLQLNDKKKEDAINFINEINKDLPGLMELEYEGFYPAGLFVAIKQSNVGAKKKYALLSEDGEITVKGFETVRRNWSIIAKEMQEKILKMILSGEPKTKSLEFVKSVIQDLRKHNISKEKVIIATQLTKEISEYDNVGPHVAIAKRMVEREMTVAPGMNIKYVVCKGKGLVRDKAKLPDECDQDDYDDDYYINNQIIPAVDKILEVLGYTKDDLLEHASQNKLDKFFG